MSIALKCQTCGAAFAVKDELAGKRIRCIQCKSVIEVVSATSPGNPQSLQQSTATTPARPAAKQIPQSPTSTSSSSSERKLPSASDAPPVRQARRVSASPDSPATAPLLGSSAAAPERRPVAQARARVVQGPRDVQADNVRHTAATLSVPPEDFEVLRRKVFSSFAQPGIERVPVARSYRLGILLVSIFMIMLPLIYICLIGVVGWGIWYHAVNHTGMMASAGGVSGRNSGRAVIFAFLLYLMPIISGGALILFMLKPLFSKSEKDSGRRSLKPDDEPLLFAFVERICQAVNAPRPQRIDIDCNVNASASFGRGLLSMVGNDLVLTIGMPLVAGLTMRQFGGVLAHEFGHFAQGAGMRLTYVIRSISYWFTRVVYERDSWDDSLAEWSHTLDIRIGWILYVTRFGVWLTRKVLWVLMVAGHLVGGYLLRQMEFDADRHEARLAGSRTFATTARQLSVLGIAYKGAMGDLGSFYREGRLGDNLPKLILLNVDQLPEKVHAKIDEMILESKTGIFDTHPSDRERMASAAKENTEGIFQLRLPAAHLFKRFDFLSRAVTWDFYKEVFGDELKKSDLHPVDQLMARQKIQQEAWKALRRFFMGHVSWYRPFTSPTVAFKPPKNVPETVAKMKQARATMLNQAERYEAARKKFDEADTRLIEIGLADILLQAGIKVRKGDFQIPLTSRSEVNDARESTEVQQGRLEPRLVPFEDAAADRLYSALQLARTSDVAAYLHECSVINGELDQLLKLFRDINELLGQLLTIRDAQIAMGKLLSVMEANSDNQRLFEQIHMRMQEMNEHIVNLRQSFEATPYPFDHARADITVADYLLKELPDPENPISLYEAADSIGHALPEMQARVTGRLCQIAEMVETRFGLPQLEDPPEPEEEINLTDDDDD